MTEQKDVLYFHFGRLGSAVDYTLTTTPKSLSSLLLTMCPTTQTGLRLYSAFVQDWRREKKRKQAV